ncbi:transcription elongation factor TFIIS-like [Aristolochia californica]|uniref:transcription elongation factor TFIIS-like n=1 Tax=Aristolochia californica TaxID=171875 RepID=UPI0035DC2760
MEKELLETFEAVSKAAEAATESEGGADEARCVDGLKRLRDIPVTMKLLVSTQVGKRLRYLTKHPREKVRVVASDLLDMWKNIVIEETSKNGKKNSKSDDKSSTKIAVKSETSDVVMGGCMKIEKKALSSEAVKVEKVSRSETVKVEKNGKDQTFLRSESIKIEKVDKNEIVPVENIRKEENKPAAGIKKPSSTQMDPPKLTSMIKCNDSVRDKLRELLAEALAKVSGEADEDIVEEVNACDPIRVAVTVESVMFENLGRSNGLHKVKYRSIMFNLKDANNPDLRRRVLLGHIKPERLIEMTPEEMASDQRKRENKQIKEKALLECERGGPPKATTDQFRCGRCGQRKTTYHQMQTRSADEPMTTFVTCVNCNNHWKFC